MQSVSDRLTTKAQSVIDKYAEDNKLDLVLDTASGRALYSSVKADITSGMITGMNNEYKKELAQNKTSKPEATKVAAKASPAKAATMAPAKAIRVSGGADGSAAATSLSRSKSVKYSGVST